MIIIDRFLKYLIGSLYMMNLNNIVLMLFIELGTFYIVRNHIVNKAKKSWSIIIWHPTLAGILKKTLLGIHLFVAVYGILVFCPIKDTTANPIPLYALYQLLMNRRTEPLTLALYNAVLLFPVGLWVGEILKPARASFLYKWTAIVTGIIGLYLEYSQHVLEVGRPAADDFLCIIIACCAGIFSRDAYEKIKQFYKMAVQVVKNEKKKRERAKQKAEEAEAKKAKDRAEAKAKEEAERKEQEEKDAQKRQKRKEAVEPYITSVKESAIYEKLTDYAAIFVVFLLAFVQWIAELVADRHPESETESYYPEEDLEEIEGEPRWKRLKRENQRQAKNPMLKKSRRMKRETMRKLRAQEDVDAELDIVQLEQEDKKELQKLKEMERELRLSRLLRTLGDDEEDVDAELDEYEGDLDSESDEYTENEDAESDPYAED